MIEAKDLKLGDYACFFVGEDKLSMPMKVCYLYENEVGLDFDGNEGDPFIREPSELMPVRITEDILLADGWEYKERLYFKKGAYRIGWRPHNSSLIVGYHELPFAVEYIHHLQHVQRMYGLEEIKL